MEAPMVAITSVVKDCSFVESLPYIGMLVFG